MKAAASILLVVLCGAGALGQSAPSADETLSHARSLAATHRLFEASEMLSDLLRDHPEDTAAWIELGQIQLQESLNEEAMHSFEEVLAREPGNAQAQQEEVRAAVAAALVDRGAGNDGAALLCLVRARKFVPGPPELLLDFGVQAGSMHIYKEADDALTHAHALAPGDAKVLYALARVQMDEQKAPEAEASFRAYLAMRPDDATAHYGLGRLLHMLARDDEAAAELQRSLALQPRQTESWYELGDIALAEHRDDEAKADYEKVLAAAPHHGGALTGMGVVAWRAKDYTASEKWLQQACLYAPDYPLAHQQYALVLAKLGRQQESEQQAAEAKALRDRQDTLRRGLALTVLP